MTPLLTADASGGVGSARGERRAHGAQGRPVSSHLPAGVHGVRVVRLQPHRVDPLRNDALAARRLGRRAGQSGARSLMAANYASKTCWSRASYECCDGHDTDRK